MTATAESLPTRFEFSTAQARVWQAWMAQRAFHSEPDQRRAYSIVIPPPNVTGALHLGHALNNTLQDVLVRTRRMQGFNTLWMPGTDHAGIATQAVVERRIREEEGKSRHDLGREELVRRIWQWKDQYEARILGQLQQLGCSCDWERTRFTLDDVCARAVRFTFFDLFQKQLVYRGKRLVNWDTFLQTAVSDDEVFNETVRGWFWHLKYPVIDPLPGEPEFVIVATTRPETMLGDTAVAVHPDPESAMAQAETDLRQKQQRASAAEQPAIRRELEQLEDRRATMLPVLLRLRAMAADGRKLRLPIVDREIPLIADAWAKPELGSGCVKITPAHDPNDYEVGQRHRLPQINILNPDGTLNGQAAQFSGLTIAVARKRVVEHLESIAAIDRVEEREIELPHSDRSKTPIEPLLANQWFVQMDTLAQSAIDAVDDGSVTIAPARYVHGYRAWLAEKRDWPVSRQLWWGHQIPVWSRTCANETLLAEVTGELARLLAAHPDRAAIQVESHETLDEVGSVSQAATIHVCLRDDDPPLERALAALELVRDPDVLDTWFSSALWPHSTLGWPERTSELGYYYPTSTLVTSRDIITLWVARMVLMGLNNMGAIPFRQVYVHPKILDGYGETMSKSKGNGVDPLDVIEKFGADALRFGMVHLTTETQDVRMPVAFECPRCGHSLEQTRKNRELPRLDCPACHQPFSTQWASSEADRALPRGAVLSERFEVARNFVNKLWNAARFSLIHLEGYLFTPLRASDLLLEDRWILSRLNTVTAQVNEHLDHFRFSEIARTIYDFAWDEFCSFYVEILKNRMEGEPRAAAQTMLAYTLDRLLRLLHPIMPFLTEEIWRHLNEIAGVRGLEMADPPTDLLVQAAWPVVEPPRIDPLIESQFARFQKVLSGLRDIRAKQNIAPKKPLQFAVRCNTNLAEMLRPLIPYIQRMANATATDLGDSITLPAVHATAVLPDIELFVDLEGLIDVQAEVGRLTKEVNNLDGQIQSKSQKLGNANFVARAPAEVVAKERESLAQLQEQRQALQDALQKLNSH